MSLPTVRRWWSRRQAPTPVKVPYVYERRSTVQWDEMAKLIAPDGAPGFGQDVDISLNTIIVKHNSAIQVFVRQGASWVHEARIELADKPDVDAAIDGNRLFLINRRTGFAHAYRRSNGIWTRQMTVGPDVNAPRFHDVAMGGGLAVLGAPTSFGAITNPNPGSAYVFRLKEVPGQKEVWVREARLHPPLIVSEAGGFGLSLDVSSNRVAVAMASRRVACALFTSFSAIAVRRPGGASIACSQAKGQHRSERRFQTAARTWVCRMPGF